MQILLFFPFDSCLSFSFVTMTLTDDYWLSLSLTLFSAFPHRPCSRFQLWETVLQDSAAGSSARTALRGCHVSTESIDTRVGTTHTHTHKLFSLSVCRDKIFRLSLSNINRTRCEVSNCFLNRSLRDSNESRRRGGKRDSVSVKRVKRRAKCLMMRSEREIRETVLFSSLTIHLTVELITFAAASSHPTDGLDLIGSREW